METKTKDELQQMVDSGDDKQKMIALTYGHKSISKQLEDDESDDVRQLARHLKHRDDLQVNEMAVMQENNKQKLKKSKTTNMIALVVGIIAYIIGMILIFLPVTLHLENGNTLLIIAFVTFVISFAAFILYILVTRPKMLNSQRALDYVTNRHENAKAFKKYMLDNIEKA